MLTRANKCLLTYNNLCLTCKLHKYIRNTKTNIKILMQHLYAYVNNSKHIILQRTYNTLLLKFFIASSSSKSFP